MHDTLLPFVPLVWLQIEMRAEVATLSLEQCFQLNEALTCTIQAIFAVINKPVNNFIHKYVNISGCLSKAVGPCAPKVAERCKPHQNPVGIDAISAPFLGQ